MTFIQTACSARPPVARQLAGIAAFTFVALGLGCGEDVAGLALSVDPAIFDNCADPDQCLSVTATWCVPLDDGSVECATNDVDLSLVLPGGGTIGTRSGEFNDANGCLHDGDEQALVRGGGEFGPFNENITCSPAIQASGPPAIESGTYFVELRDDFPVFDTGSVVVDINTNGDHLRLVVHIDDGSAGMIPIFYDNGLPVPPAPPIGASASAIGSGYDHTCAIDDTGVICWGDNSDGQTAVPLGLVNPSEVSGGDDHTCAIDDNGVTCWGDSTFAQTAVPIGLVNTRGLSVGPLHSCVIHDSGVSCWGDNSHGQSAVPGNLINPRAVSAGGQHTCAIDDIGVKCWGTPGSFNVFGQQLVPPGLVNPSAISAGTGHTCAVDDNGVTCWGRNSDGELTPSRLLVNPTHVRVGGAFTCVIDDVGLVCWGENRRGQTNVPITVLDPTAIAPGGRHTCVIDNDSVTCWGHNSSGQSTVPDGL